MKKAIFLFIYVFVSLTFLSADVYIKQISHHSSFWQRGELLDTQTSYGRTRKTITETYEKIEEPPKEVSFEIWIGENRYSIHGPDISIIVNLDENLMCVVHHQNKSYFETKLPLRITDILSKKDLKFRSKFYMKASVSPSSQTKSIGEWTCKGYDARIEYGRSGMLGIPNYRSEVYWATSDVPFDWISYTQKIYPIINSIKYIYFKSESLLRELSKIDGFVVASKTIFPEIPNLISERVISMETVELSEKTAPVGTYSVPEGYTKMDDLILNQTSK